MGRMTARVPKRRWRVVVEFVTDDRRGIVKQGDALEYVKDALEAWHGQYQDDDPRMANIKEVDILQLRERPERE